ncbi:BMP family ABC transporter substrate-binding protein [Microbacterium album]|uniref:BMP family ABC transporter substrate-binding protein n=1 Tax=Microbacterium album TaxID=2053191 RepID=A0A917MKX2_9MICO|nr:BMP family ABC transporter substrate-binding protein [Microbacterium album]
MISTTKRTALGGLAIAGTAILLAGCGQAPEDTGGASGDVDSDFLPCLISDEGGWNDRSFNQSAKEGLDRALEELGVEGIEMESNNANDYAPNLETLVSEGCSFIISVGFNLAAATVESALANPEIDYAIIDDYADTDFDGETDAPNIKPLVFNTAEAAYLGGYAAAAWSAESGVNKVGTFGGGEIPSVKVFMDGFQLGVEKFNEDKDGSVEVFGWNTETQQGSFTGGFAANDVARQQAQGLLDQGVDVLLPVGGPIYMSAAAAIRDSDDDVLLLGVDSDIAVKDPELADIVLVSILKAIDQAVYDATLSAASGDFDVEPYVGTLANEGVALSSFHDFEDQLPEGTLDELAALQEAIIAGDVTVDSPNSP